MKQLFHMIAVILIISSLICQMSAFAESDISYLITEYKNEECEKWLWDIIYNYIKDPKITAGILAYFERESSYVSDAVAGYGDYGMEFGRKLCTDFTSDIDNGLSDGTSREDFIYGCSTKYGGYGLGQWCSPYYAERLFDFAQEWGTSIADAEMQCAFTVQSIKEHPTELWELIKDEDNVERIGRYIGIYYDGSQNGAEIIAGYAKLLYEKYGMARKLPFHIFFAFLKIICYNIYRNN